jgi:transposase InsO family protein
MWKYTFFAKVRRANPYRKMGKATEVHCMVPNHLNREFEQFEPRKASLTAMTYLQYQGGQTAYLSCVKDIAIREIVACEFSTTMRMKIVYRTLAKLKEALGENVRPEALIHSNQEDHYTNPEYEKRAKGIGLHSSMSQRGNCLDNAPMESFFGHLKDEVDYKEARNFNELKLMIDDYIEYYNTSRKQ